MSRFHNSISFIDRDRETQLPYKVLAGSARQNGWKLKHLINNRYGEILVLTCDTSEFIKAFWSVLSSGSTMVIIPESDACDGIDFPTMLNTVIPQLTCPIILTSRRINTEQLSKFLNTKLDEHTISQEFKLLLPEQVQLESLYETNSVGAVIQFSSGSTGSPKGVCLPAEALALSSQAISDKLHITSSDNCLSWLPIAHNFAIFGFHLTATMCDIPQTIMTPITFLNDPLRWLEEMSARGTTITGAPIFAYQLILTVLRLSPPKAGINLQKLRVIVNGAEPVSFQLVKQFETALAQYAMRNNIVVPAYGMAEATVGITIDASMQGGSQLYCDRNQLNPGQSVKILAADDANAVVLTSVGTTCQGVTLRIIDGDSPVQDGVVGEIAFKSSMMMNGYYRSYNDRSDQNKHAFKRNDWLRTGDLGVVIDDELYITGRIKDIIVINGKNYYPQDFETILLEIDSSLQSHLSVAGIHDSATSSEGIGTFIEGIPEDRRRELTSKLRKEFSRRTGLRLAQVSYLSHLPRTYNGKVKRNMLANIN